MKMILKIGFVESGMNPLVRAYRMKMIVSLLLVHSSVFLLPSETPHGNIIE